MVAHTWLTVTAARFAQPADGDGEGGTGHLRRHRLRHIVCNPGGITRPAAGNWMTGGFRLPSRTL
jgi:hypothetical protein